MLIKSPRLLSRKWYQNVYSGARIIRTKIHEKFAQITENANYQCIKANGEIYNRTNNNCVN